MKKSMMIACCLLLGLVFIHTGLCGTYIYYNEKGEEVKYIPKPKQLDLKPPSGSKQSTETPLGEPDPSRLKSSSKKKKEDTKDYIKK